MNLHFVIPEDAEDFVYEAACNLAFRYGMETTAYEGALIGDKEAKGNQIVFEEKEECGINWEEVDGRILVKVSGRGQKLLEFVADICEHFPMQGTFDTWTDRLKEIGTGLRMHTLDGQKAYVKAYAGQGARAL